MGALTRYKRGNRRTPIRDLAQHLWAPPTGLQVGWDQTLQDEVVTVQLPNDRLSDSRLACMAHASFLISATYAFRAPEAQRRFEAIKKASSELAAMLREYREQARHWLDERGLLAGALGIRDQVGTLDDRARRIEVYCGFGPASVLEVQSGNVYVRPRSGLKVIYDDLAMLLNVLAVAMPESAVALVGEEALAKKSGAP